MAAIDVGRYEIDLDVTAIDGRVWYVCPVRGESCGRVLADLGSMAVDSMAWHLQREHWYRRLGV